MPRVRTEKRVCLDILYCVNCRKNSIPPDAFPHYCTECLEYLHEHGKMPDPDVVTNQMNLSGGNILDEDEEIPEENRQTNLENIK